MSLLKDIHDLSKTHLPKETVVEENTETKPTFSLHEAANVGRVALLEAQYNTIEEVGLDINDPEVFATLTKITEGFGRSERQAAGEWAQGRGVDLYGDERQKAAQSGLDNPRLGLGGRGAAAATGPQPGAIVIQGGGMGAAKVTRVEGEEVFIADKSGRESSVPLQALSQKKARTKDGRTVMVWIER